ncbi:MAG: DUF1592 domain-containing protein [Pseudomonadota bacterium]
MTDKPLPLANRAARSLARGPRPPERRLLSRLGSCAGALSLLVGACSSQVAGTPSTGGGPGSGGSANGGAGGVTATGGSGNGGAAGANGSGGSGPPCVMLPPIEQRVWRLSATQYSNATRDLLTLTTSPTVESSTDGVSAYALFSDVSLTVSDSFLFSGFYQTAENIITQIAPRLAQIATCNTGEAPTVCATRFAADFGLRAFRRPLDATEVTNLMKVYTQGAMTDFNTGISLMIEALILSPSFLYRTELGPTTLAAGASGMLTPYEVATQLGFLFLNSAPDVLLMKAAAATGDMGLGTPAGIMAQVDRLLALTATKTNLTNVVTNWFSIGQLGDKANKDPAQLATLAAADRDQPAIVGELLASAQQFVDDTLWTNPAGKVTDLLTSQKVFVNKRLATLYGLPFSGATPATFVSTTWPAAQQRIGILTQPSFLWAVSAASETSIVKRGQFIHDDVVCQDPLPPPIDLSTPSALAIIAMGDSEVTKSDARMAPTAVCSGCHAQMDNYSRILQNFGPVGAYRTVDEANRPINTSVTFSGSSPLAPMTIAGPTAFGQALMSTKVLAGCGVQKMASYAVGNMIRKYNTCELQELRTQFDQSDGTMSSLFKKLAAANFVRARVGGAK